MQQPAQVDLYGDRWTPFVATLNFTGLVLTGATVAMHVRDTYDKSGTPRVSLGNVVSSSAEGLYIADADTLGIRINESTMESLPMPGVGVEGDVGDDLTLYWDLHITPSGGAKQVYARGKFIVRGGATQ